MEPSGELGLGIFAPLGVFGIVCALLLFFLLKADKEKQAALQRVDKLHESLVSTLREVLPALSEATAAQSAMTELMKEFIRAGERRGSQ